MRSSGSAGRFEHVVRERCDNFAGLLDCLDDVCRVVELGFNFVLNGVEHLREAEQVVFRFVEKFICITERNEICRFAFHRFLDFFNQRIADRFLFFNNFGSVFSQDICRERAEFLKLCRNGAVCLKDRTAKATRTDLWIDGNRAVRCSVIVAADALFDLMEFVIRIEIDVGFDVFEWCVKRYGFACDGDAVGEAIFTVERFCFVKVVRTVDKMVHAHEQVVCVVGLFEEARRVLVQLRFEYLTVAFGNGGV